MAILEDTTTATEHHLFPSTLIGRSRTCNLTVSTPEVSGQHALLRWTGAEWELRDLGSRNGTYINGSRLEAGERVVLSAGTVLGLGANDERWVLRDAAPPFAVAIPLGGGEVVLAERGMLSLPPDAELPEVAIYRDTMGQWVVERDQETEPVGEHIEVGGTMWRLVLPEIDEETIELKNPTIRTVSLRFEVSRDEEYARMIVVHAQKEIPLEARSHHYLLLTLARMRLEDQAESPDDATAHGWVHQLELARMLRVRERQVNLQIFRARKQLAEAGIEEAAGIVERRSPGRQLRIGVSSIEIEVI